MAKSVEPKADDAYEEGEKLFYDSMKHLTTLNTGSVLLLVAFLEKLFRAPQWRALIAAALCSFLLSTVCSVSSMLQSANYVKHSGKFRALESSVKNLIYYVSLVTFLMGIVFLVTFAVKNLY